MNRERLPVSRGVTELPGHMARACSDAGLNPESFLKKGRTVIVFFRSCPMNHFARSSPGWKSRNFPVPCPAPLEEFAGVLEHFLGMRIQAADGSRVKRVGKSAMLYTGSVDIPPQDIIGYVVRETAGLATETSMTDSGQVYRFLDPACGAGLFLLAAYGSVRTRARSAGRFRTGG